MTLAIPGVVAQVVLGVGLAATGWLHATPELEFAGGIGLVLLLFSAGADTDARALLRCGRAAALVATLGVVFSLIAGTSVAIVLGWPLPAALFAGGVLTATSVAISAQILQRSGWLARDEGRVVLGAAVADDVAGLLLLSLVISMYSSGTGVREAILAAGWAVAFVALALIAGLAVSARLQRWMRSPLTANAICAGACLVGALAARVVGLEPFLGSFLAGAAIPVDATHGSGVLKRAGTILAPVYFVLLGARVDLATLGDGVVLLSALAFLIAGTAAKLLSGLGGKQTWDRIAVGIAMVPRGEVGLVFAAAGLASGALAQSGYLALVGAVLASSLLGPLLLGFRISGRERLLVTQPV